MKPWISLRTLAWMKRSALALESISESLAVLAEKVERDAEPKKRPRMAEVFTPTIEEMNQMWRDRQSGREE